MKISKKEIQHIANLAHISLSIKELGMYQDQLQAILDYFKQLDEVDTSMVDKIAHASGLKNVWRDDVVNNWPQEEVDLALSQGDKEARYIKVKKVL